MKNILNAKIRTLASTLAVIFQNCDKLQLKDLKIGELLKTALSIENKATVTIQGETDKEVEENKCKFYNEMPYHPLPNACIYEIRPRPLNGISGIFGIAERERGSEKKILNGNNKKANNFVEHYFNTLGRLRDAGRSREYGRLAVKLLNNEGFRGMAINHVCSGFHMDRTEGELERIGLKLESLVKTKSLSIPMKRVYIPKANGKWRPLGVPEVAGRVYLHMGNTLIVGGRMGKDRNHAYFPHKGVHTAWDELLPQLESAENIYEFDLQSFFPSVNISELEKLMVEQLDFPPRIAKYLADMHRSITKIPKDQKLDEQSDLTALLTPSNEVNPNLSSPTKESVIAALNEKGDTKKGQKLNALLKEGGTIYRKEGIPQGTATSCGLATISLHNLGKNLGKKLLMYADDGILFPTAKEEVLKLSDEARGIRPNLSKSEGAKVAGGGIKSSIKFLGIRYFPSTSTSEGRIASDTRSKFQLEYSVSAQLLTFLRREGDNLIKNVQKVKGNEKELINEELIVGPYGCRTKFVSSDPERVMTAEEIEAERCLSVIEGLNLKASKFAKMSNLERLNQLFKTTGLKSLAGMFAGRGQIPVYEQIEQYKKGSGLHLHAGHVLFQEINERWRDALDILYYRHISKLKIDVRHLPKYVEDIGDNDGSEVFEGKELERALKIQEEMEGLASVISEKANSKSGTPSLQSLFRGNMKNIVKSPIDETLVNCLKKLLADFPLSKSNMSSLAISGYLSEGFSGQREIRSCIALKSRRKLVTHIPHNVKPKELKRTNLNREFLKTFGVKLKHLTQVLASK